MEIHLYTAKARNQIKSEHVYKWFKHQERYPIRLEQMFNANLIRLDT